MSINVSDILSKKISEIQGRLPVKMNSVKINDFEDVLNDATQNLQEKTQKKSRPVSNSASTEEINAYIQAASQKYGVDSELIRAVMSQESGFNPNAVSKAGAEGLMQLMPETAASLKVTDSFDIAQNIDGGTKYLKQQLNTFGGNVSLALAAYNAGPNNVIKANGIPAYAETQDYVKKVIGNYQNSSKNK